jgi:hypothetical protein
MTDLILKEESCKIIGACMEVHKVLGMGFKEIIYYLKASGIKLGIIVHFGEKSLSYKRVVF